MTAELTFRDVCKVLFRHKRKCIAFFLIAMTVVTGLSLMWPKTYRSYGKLFVKMGRENVMLDPTASMGQSSRVAIPQAREDEINTVVEILKSRTLVEKVVERIGADAILGPAKTEGNGVSTKQANKPMSPSMKWLKQQAGFSSMSRDDVALVKVMRNLKSEGIRRSNVVMLYLDSDVPETAQLVLDCVINTYLDEHIRLNRTPGANEFLKQQTDQLKNKLAVAEEKLRAMKDETGLYSPIEQRAELVTRIARLEDEYLLSKANIAAAEGEINVLQKRLESTSPTNVVKTTGLGHLATDGMRGRLFELELEEKRLLTRLNPSHFEVKQIQEQIKRARAIVDAQEPDRNSLAEESSAVYETLASELYRKEPQISSLSKKGKLLNLQIEQQKQDLAQLNADQLRLADMERKIELLDSSYRTYLTNLEQTRIDEEREKQRISNISVIQPASLSRQPVKPQLYLNVLLGFIFAATGSMGLALACEFFDHSLKSPEDIEKQLDIPTLGSVPQLRRRELVLSGRN